MGLKDWLKKTREGVKTGIESAVSTAEETIPSEVPEPPVPAPTAPPAPPTAPTPTAPPTAGIETPLTLLARVFQGVSPTEGYTVTGGSEETTVGVPIGVGEAGEAGLTTEEKKKLLKLKGI